MSVQCRWFEMCFKFFHFNVVDLMLVKSDVTLDRTRDNNQIVYFAEFRLLAGTYGPLILSSYYFLLSVWI